jgi:polyisoprenoid-binding protein YceI
MTDSRAVPILEGIRRAVADGATASPARPDERWDPTMTSPVAVTRGTSWYVPVLLGAALCALLWLLGRLEIGWVGFLVAGLVWPALQRAADPGGDGVTPTAVLAPPGRGSAGAAPFRPLTELPTGRFSLDPALSEVVFEVRKLGWPVRGRWISVTGEVETAGEPAASRIAVTVPANTFHTKNPVRDRHILGPAFLDSDRFPELRFESTRVAARSDGTWEVAGTMTVHGVAAPVTFAVDSCRWTAGGRTLVLTARTAVRRSWFGVAGYRWLVGDQVLVQATAAVDVSR